jgi:hypothetical protein
MQGFVHFTKAETRTAPIRKIFSPESVNIFEDSSIRFYLPENSLYDTVYFRFSQDKTDPGSMVYHLNGGDVPVHGYFQVKIRANVPVALRNKMVMERSWNTKKDYSKAVPLANWTELGWFSASFREFGDFRLLADTLPPTIESTGLKEGMDASKLKRIAFVVKDNMEEISAFTALLDGKWLRFSNDKGRVFVYNFDDLCKPGPHELKVSAEDLVGNRTERIFHFVR